MLDSKLVTILGLLVLTSTSVDWSKLGFIILGAVVTVTVFWRFLLAHPGWAVFGFMVTGGLSFMTLSDNYWLTRFAVVVLPLLFFLGAKTLIPPAPHEIEIERQE